MDQKIAALLSFALLLSCKTLNQNSLRDSQSLEQAAPTWTTYSAVRPKKLEMCAAIRGNGNYIFAHWGQLARALEHYGPIDAVAGGSSASATSFLYESIYINPIVWWCDGGASQCSELQRARRMSFLVKSLREFISVFGERGNFAAAATSIPQLAQRFKQGDYANAVANGDLQSAVSHAITLLSSDEFSGIIDPKIVPRLKASLANPNSLNSEISELQGAIRSLDWKADDPAILLRRGLIDFEALAKRAGIAADFYAGRDVEANVELMEILDGCAEKSVGLHWQQTYQSSLPNAVHTDPREISTPPATNSKSSSTTCGDAFRVTLNKFLDRFNKSKIEPSRLTDAVGGTLPALISTSIYDSKEADAHMRSTYSQFLDGHSSFDSRYQSKWIQFGYWGNAEDLAEVQKNKQRFTDLKTQRFHSLGPAQWGEALRVSPQEPGLGSVLCNYERGSLKQRGRWDSLPNLPPDTQCHRWSLGGWSDLYPVQVLKNLGCERVVYATRQDDEGNFVRGVAKLLTSDDQDWKALDLDLFALDNTKSAAAQALKATSASLCSDWNMIQSHEINCLGENAYASPILSRDPFFLNHGGGARGKRLKEAGFKVFNDTRSKPPIRGCMLGAPLSKEARKSPCTQASADGQSISP